MSTELFRKYLDIVHENSQPLEEDWRKAVATGLMGASLLSPFAASAQSAGKAQSVQTQMQKKDWSTGTGGQIMKADVKAKILKMSDEDAREALAAWKVLTDPKVPVAAQAGAGEYLGKLLSKVAP